MSLQSLGLLAVGGVLAALLGGWAVVVGARGRTPTPGRPPSALARRWRAARAELPPAWRRHYRWLVTAAAVTGTGAWAVTGWPVHGLIAAGAVLGLPYVLNPGGSAGVRIERLEALSQWLYHLAGIHTAGLTLAQTITASAKSAPEPIAPAITRLAADLRAAHTPADAFERFAQEMGDGVVDHITLLFMTHAQASGPGLSDALESLAASIAQAAADARSVDADRAKVRHSARLVSLFVLFIVTVCMLNPAYTAPYGTAGGQILLAVLGGLFGFALARLRRIARAKPEPRLLAPRSPAAEEGIPA